tara:strand:+ start:436 stop:882 length:447 start_codon:yes stop_codon:yes gene_type:complete
MSIASKLASKLAKKFTKKKPNSKGNTKSIFRGQSSNQAKTQKATEGQRRYKVGQVKGAVVGGSAVLAVGAARELYKKDATFRSRLDAAQKAGKTTVTYKGSTYKVPKNKIPSPPPSKPRTTFSGVNKGKRISYAERFKEIENEKKAKK